MYLILNMPSALTMLDCYQRQLAASRGAGLAGTIRALIDVVNDDYDPRGPGRGLSHRVRAR